MTEGRTSRRRFLIGAAMGCAAGGATWAMPRRAEHRLSRSHLSDFIPKQIGPWRFETPDGVIVSAEDDGPKDGYDQVLTRVYTAVGQPTIMLLIAYGSTQGGSLQLHRPETCYPGQGFRLSNHEQDTFRFPGSAPVAVRRFTARRDDRSERLMYWTRISSEFPRNTAEEYAAILKGVLKGVIPDGILVRISTFGENAAVSDAKISEFARDMVAATPPSGQELLLGGVIHHG